MTARKPPESTSCIAANITHKPFYSMGRSIQIPTRLPLQQHDIINKTSFLPQKNDLYNRQKTARKLFKGENS